MTAPRPSVAFSGVVGRRFATLGVSAVQSAFGIEVS